MKTNLLMVNTNLYAIFGNMIFRINNGEFHTPTKLEIQNVKNKLERNKNDLFKSKKINKIANKNPELKRVDILEDILDDIEKTIPIKYRKSFYNNLETLKIKFVYNSPVEKSQAAKDNGIYSPACYCPATNEIIVAIKEMNGEKNIFSKLSNTSYTYKDELKGTLIHELFHMASRNLDSKLNIYVTGIITVDEYTFDILNRSLNEGITDCQRKKIHAQDERIIQNNYNLQIALTNQLSALIGEDTIFDSYYNSKNTKLIEKRLLEIINDTGIVNELIDKFSNIGLVSGDEIEIETASYVQCILLDFFKEKINICIKNKDVKQIKKIVKTLNDNFIDIKIDGKRVINGYTEFNLEALEDIKLIASKIRKRKKEK